MYGTTVEDIIRLTLDKLHSVPGIGTQVYAEDTIGNKITETVRYILTRYEIPWYRVFVTVTIDGVNGLPTVSSDISAIKSVEDVLHFYEHDTERKILFPPPNFNPFKLTGTKTKYIQPRVYSTASPYCFHTWPKTATDQLDIIGINRPLTLDATELVYFDPDLISDAVAGKIVESDGTNPGWAGNLIATFEERLVTMFANYQRNTANSDGRGSSWPTTFYSDANLDA